MTARGLFTIANDVTYDWLVALLESVQATNPGLPVTVIPFDSRIERVASLTDRFDMHVTAEEELSAIDALGRRLWPGGQQLLRKIAAFEGSYESFMFLDADVVVLQPLGRFFEVHEPDTVHYFLENRQEVYDPGPFRARMAARHSARGVITGQWGALRGALRVADFARAAEDTAEVSRQSFWAAGEQTFLNFTFDTGPADVVAYADALEGVGLSWAGGRFVRTDQGLVEQLTATQRATGTAPMLHWAGYQLGVEMPMYRLWEGFRLASATPSERLQWRARVTARWARRHGQRTVHSMRQRAARDTSILE